MLYKDLKIGQKFKWVGKSQAEGWVGVRVNNGWHYIGESDSPQIRTAKLWDNDPVELVQTPLVKVSIESVPLGTMVAKKADGPLEYRVVSSVDGLRYGLKDNFVYYLPSIYIPAVTKPLSEFKVGDKVLLGGRDVAVTVQMVGCVYTDHGTFPGTDPATAIPT